MGNTNASPTFFGFDFQVNAAIVLMLENIKDLYKLRLEGESEDIEITMNSGKKVYAQAKSVVKASSDFHNVREKARSAIKTLSEADSNDVEKLILITNSTNPLNEETSKGFFYGPPTDVGYNDLTEGGQNVIDSIIEQLGVDFDKSKFRIKTFRFETDNDNERYKVILQMINDFLSRLDNSRIVSASELMSIWQNDIFKNGSKTDMTIQLEKKGLVWPIIVLAIGKDAPYELLDDYDKGLADEISSKYAELIDNCTERYEIVTRILYDYNERTPVEKLSRKQRAQWYVNSYWNEYVDVLELGSLDNELQEGVAKIVLSRVIQQRYTIDAIKKEVAL